MFRLVSYSFAEFVWNRNSLTIQGKEFYPLHQLAFEPSEEAKTVEIDGRVIKRYYIRLTNSKQPICSVSVSDDQQPDFESFQNALINSKLSRLV